MPTVVVLGAAYGGRRAVQILLDHLPSDWRIVAIDKNTHFNHLYAFPRMAVLRGHENKPFVPYNAIFKRPNSTPQENDDDEELENENHVLLHARVDKLEPNTVHFTLLTDHHESTTNKKNPYSSCESGSQHSLQFDYCVYALGSHLPAPMNVTSDRSLGTKLEGVAWLAGSQARVEKAKSVLIVGGGALGVQMASDVADIYPNQKKITLLHSGPRLLPRFNPWMHDSAYEKLKKLGVNIILSSRADLSSCDMSDDNKVAHGRTIKTINGEHTLEADLVLICTGQKPNTDPLKSSPILASAINPATGLVSVNRHLQISTNQNHVAGIDVDSNVNYNSNSSKVKADHEEVCENVFVIGDVADAFGALKAGHTAWGMGELAARNICWMVQKELNDKDSVTDLGLDRLDLNGNNRNADITADKKNNDATLGENDDDTIALEEYNPPPYAIKVSLGLSSGIIQRGKDTLHADPTTCYADLNCAIMWTSHGMTCDDFSI